MKASFKQLTAWIGLAACSLLVVGLSPRSPWVTQADASIAAHYDADCVNCVPCTNQPDYHRTAADDGGQHKNSHSYCILNPENGLCSGHPRCGSGTELPNGESLVEALVALTAEHDVSRLNDLLERHPDLLVINGVRSAMQVLGCDGQPIAHIPLSPPLLARLAE